MKPDEPLEGEIEFENKLIKHLTNLGSSKQWEYVPEINNEDQLWDNFRTILERNNQDKLHGVPLTDTEFNQVKKTITDLATPYDAGRWLYGMNGVTQVAITRDADNAAQPEAVYLTVFDQAQVGGGNTTYQIVNQIRRQPVLAGHKSRRFDTTLLINGLPIIHIEEKFDRHDVNEALNQIQEYVSERLFTGIYSTVQIFVGITPHEAKYMANFGTPDAFNKAFAFMWQYEDTSKPVFEWKDFANLMLSIPMAHNMATNYMILDSEPNHNRLMVMRPYQVYATKRVIEAIRNYRFEYSDGRLGYIWHTTGSGKTVSSFKAAWLASRLPRVDKVVFVVDRIALTKQTYEKYNAYDPDSDDTNSGVISDTANVGALAKALKSSNTSHNITVTSIQKLGILAKRKNWHTPKKNFVFIVDEAHRSTNGKLLDTIKKKFPGAAWIGYTGTPAFDGDLTYKVFGAPLHKYTIREAIQDQNVLGFHVDFEHTLSDDVVKETLLPEVLASAHPNWDEATINRTIARMAPEDVDSYIDSGIYDMNEKHVHEVVQDIVKHWTNRSAEGRYGAILTTHVGGGKQSSPMAIMYFNEFQKANEQLVSQGKKPLNVAMTFSYASDNHDGQAERNNGLLQAIDIYNKTFGTAFDANNISGYFDDVMNRIAGKQEKGEKLDIVIVIDQLLTGFDAPKVNTLYVDRTLSGANLIQAYSRTNRIDDMQFKPFGRIVNYRWPNTSKMLMDKALQVYANRGSADVQLTLENIDTNSEDEAGVLDAGFEQRVKKTKEILDVLSALTDHYTVVPASEAKQLEAWNNLGALNNNLSALKQYTEFNQDDPQELEKKLGITKDHLDWLQGPCIHIIYENTQSSHSSTHYYDLDFTVEHIREVKINYDYISELLAQILNDSYEGKNTDEIYKQLSDATGHITDRRYANQLVSLADDARSNLTHGVDGVTYPVTVEQIPDALTSRANIDRRKQNLEFRKRWGLVDIELAKALLNQIIKDYSSTHTGFDTSEDLRHLLKLASGPEHLYKTDAQDPAVRALSPLKYRTELNSAIREFVEELVLTYGEVSDNLDD